MTDAFDKTATTGAGPASSVPAPGTQLGKYKLRRLIGSGGMGNVWAAHDPDLDREIAIKLLRSADSDLLRTRLLREARAMARLKHPNVLTVYEVGTVGDRDYIAMELVDGTNLDDWLTTRPAAPEIWDALLGAGRGLAAAHDAGLVHRDFKPHNVLRSKAGRVLVTDFGLARGLGDDAAASPVAALDTTAVPSERMHTDSLLDSPLTRTGQLIGTPAYMAPEQFAGAAPDPRTDQFAFCVTAWQAFAGERPYRGATIDELRKAAAAERSAAKLPPGLRPVLLRGLDPEPSSRWQDMPALLHALERVRHPRRRWWSLLALVAALIAGGVLVASLRGSPAKPIAACDPGEQVIASGWSPAARADVLAKQPQAEALLAPLDAYRDAWLVTYAGACKLDAPARTAKVACLVSLRDDLAAYVEVVTRFDPKELRFGHLDFADLVSPPKTCDGDAATSRPRFPDDSRRGPALGLFARSYGEMVVSPDKLNADHKTLIAEAGAIGWQPLVPKIEALVGVASQKVELLADAKAAYTEAARLAHDAHDPDVEARARLGLLDVAREYIADVMPKHVYEDLLHDAEVAVASAGNPPGALSSLDVARAAHAGYVDNDLSAAIDLGERALAEARRSRVRHVWERAVSELADNLSIRAKPGDLDRATSVLTEIQKAYDDPMPSPALRPLTAALYWNAWLRGDLTAAHHALDWPDAQIPILLGGPEIRGRVVDESGRGVANARVINWQGDVFGDATRVYTDLGPRMQMTTTDADGGFAFGAPESSAVIAEFGERRSLPVRIKSGMTLTLAPTTTIRGRVDVGGDPAIGVEPFVRIRVMPDVTWSVSTAPSADGNFSIVGIPRGANAILGAVGSHWPRQTGRRIEVGPASDRAVIHWPVGASFDVIIKIAAARVWVLRGNVQPRTRAELEALAARASDVAEIPITAIGWGNSTPVGIGMYHTGDHHAVIGDVGPGELTICILTSDSNVECASVVSGGAKSTLRDSRHWFVGSAFYFPTHTK